MFLPSTRLIPVSKQLTVLPYSRKLSLLKTVTNFNNKFSRSLNFSSQSAASAATTENINHNVNATTLDPTDDLSDIVSAKDVKRLRDITGSSFGNCRRALVESKNDIDKAMDWLKKKNVAAAKSRWEKQPGITSSSLSSSSDTNINDMTSTNSTSSSSAGVRTSNGRILPEGLIGMYLNASKTSGALVKIGAETDFVIKNSVFQEAVLETAKKVVDVNVKSESESHDSDADSDSTNNMEHFKGETEIYLTQIGAKVGENLGLGEIEILNSESESDDSNGGTLIESYIHPYSPEDISGVGRVGSLVQVNKKLSKPSADSDFNFDASAIAKKLSRHIAAQTPKYTYIKDIEPDVLESEKQIYKAQIMENMENNNYSKIPLDKIDLIIEGKLKKFYGEEVLMEQSFLYDDGLTVGKWLEKELGGGLKKERFEEFLVAWKLLEVKK